MQFGSWSRVLARVVVVTTFAVALAPTPAHAYTFRSTAEGAPVRWPSDTIELRVDETLCGAPDLGAQVARDAADAWADAPRAPRMVVVGAATGRPGYRGDGRDENGVYVMRRWDYAPALAVTVTSSREQDGVILDADVLVSSRDDLAVMSRSGEAMFDLQSVLTHELGHVLGLGESDAEGATMWPAQRRGELDGRSIDADDVDGVADLYGAHASVAAYGCAAGGSAGSLGGLIAIAIALVVARRRVRARAATLALGAMLVAVLVAFGGDTQRTQVAEVIASEVEDRDGLHVTIAHVITEAGEERIVEIPGGTRDGIVQQVGDIEAPRTGDTIVIEDAAW